VALGKTPEEKVAEDRRKLAEREAHQQDCERRLAVREARPRRSAEAAQATKVAKAEGSLEEELPGIASAINQETSALNTGSGGAVPARDNTEEAREVTRGDQNFPKVIAAVEVIAARGAGVYCSTWATTWARPRLADSTPQSPRGIGGRRANRRDPPQGLGKSRPHRVRLPASETAKAAAHLARCRHPGCCLQQPRHPGQQRQHGRHHGCHRSQARLTVVHPG